MSESRLHGVIPAPKQSMDYTLNDCEHVRLMREVGPFVKGRNSSKSKMRQVNYRSLRRST
jgi:hypothetical protein